MIKHARRKSRSLSAQANMDGRRNELNEMSWLLLDHQDFVGWRKPEVGVVSSCIVYLSDPNNRPYRYVIAVLLSFIMGMLYYVPDLPAGTQATTIRVLGIDDTRYSMIFSAYTWADIVMSIVGSTVVNQYLGIHLGFIVFLGLVAIGQFTCTVGCFVGSFWIYLFGRIIIGSGTGTATSIGNSFQVLWFEGKEISFVIALGRCMCRLMATVALFTPQLLYDSLVSTISSPLNRLGITQMTGMFATLLSILFATLVILLDKYGAKFIGRKPPKNLKKIHTRDVLSFPVSFWIIALLCAVYYGTIISFTGNGSLFYVSRYNMNLKMANLANSLSYASIVFLTPFIALLVDLIGYNLVWGFCGIMLSMIPFFVFMLGGNDPYIPFANSFVYSFSFSVFGSAIWVTPSFIVGKHQVTTAYGVTMSIYSLFNALIGVVSGAIVDRLGYFFLLIFYLLLLSLISMLCVSLSVSEIFSGKRVLNISGKQRRSKTKK